MKAKNNIKATKLVGVLNCYLLSPDDYLQAMALISKYQDNGLIEANEPLPGEAIKMLNLPHDEYSFWLKVEKAISLRVLEGIERKKDLHHELMNARAKIIVPTNNFPLILCEN